MHVVEVGATQCLVTEEQGQHKDLCETGLSWSNAVIFSVILPSILFLRFFFLNKFIIKADRDNNLVETVINQESDEKE